MTEYDEMRAQSDDPEFQALIDREEFAYSLPMPELPPCPVWCEPLPGEHPSSRGVDGSVVINHGAVLLPGEISLEVGQTDTVAADGSFERTPIVLDLTAEMCDAVSPEYVRAVAAGLIAGAERFEQITGSAS